MRSAADTLDIQERQRIVRLIVKEILIGDESIIVRHSIPVSQPPNGDPKSPPSRSVVSEDQSYLLRSGRHVSDPLQHCAQRDRGTLREVDLSPHEAPSPSQKRRSDGGARARQDRRRSLRVLAGALRRRLLVLVSGTQEDALAEKSALAEHLRRSTGLELSPEKTRVTAVTDGFEFLGVHVTMRWDKRYGYGPRVEIPKAKAADLRRKVKLLTGSNTPRSVLARSSKRSTPSCEVGELLPLLRLCRPRVFQSRLVHRRSSLAVAAEETPKSERG